MHLQCNDFATQMAIGRRRKKAETPRVRSILVNGSAVASNAKPKLETVFAHHMGATVGVGHKAKLAAGMPSAARKAAKPVAPRIVRATLSR